MLDVDAALVRLARERGASLITVDHNLAKVAEALRVPVAQINALASKFRVAVLGRGRDHRAVWSRRGVSTGRPSATSMTARWWWSRRRPTRSARSVEIKVTNVIQTTTGRMVFAALAPESASVDESEPLTRP